MQQPDGTFNELTDEEVKAKGGPWTAEGRVTTKRRTPPDKVLYVGQEVTVNGARFVVRKIGKKDVVLRGVPEAVGVERGGIDFPKASLEECAEVPLNAMREKLRAAQERADKVAK